MLGRWLAEEEMAGQMVDVGRMRSGMSRQDRCLVKDKRLGGDWRVGGMDKGDGGWRVYISMRWCSGLAGRRGGWRRLVARRALEYVRVGVGGSLTESVYLL